jgi:hypothetical protein
MRAPIANMRRPFAIERFENASLRLELANSVFEIAIAHMVFPAKTALTAPGGEILHPRALIAHPHPRP